MREKQFEIGTVDRVGVLYQKEALIISQMQNASSKINEIISMINLYESIGGVDIFESL